jgi:diguanylate cyclase (GGDEF)-like protein/PAS domain S-box-containing protein
VSAPSAAAALLAAVSTLTLGILVVVVVRAIRSARELRRRLDSMGADQLELRQLLDELPDAVLIVDGCATVQSANVAAANLTERDSIVGTALGDLVAADHRDIVDHGLQRALAGEQFDPLIVHVGDRIVEAIFGRASGGRVAVRLRDVSERERSSLALEQARRRFQQAFHSAPTGMALVRLDDGRVVDANQSLGEMLGLDNGHLVGRTLREFTHPDDVKEAVPHRARLELGIVDSYRIDQRYRRSDGEYIWARTRVSSTEDDGVMLAITHIEDVTEQRRTAEQLTHAARHDELTGLPNRSYLMHLLEERLESAAPSSVGVIFVDLDQFKVVNDSLGHGMGDELLVVVAARLRDVVRDDDVLARFGGDEFVVVIDGEGYPVDPGEVAERIRRAVLAPVMVDDHELFVTASIGFSLNVDGMGPADLLRDADAAMYRAKDRGRDRVEAFQAGGHVDSALALRTAGELRKGIERDEIVPYFQPIVDLETGRIVGFEALARWLHPDRGLLPPSDFLPLAEETGLLVELGTAMLRNSLAQLARWRAVGMPAANGFISVNVGTRQLIDPAFHSLVAGLLAETGIDADSVWLEITETALLADVKAVTVSLRELRNLGLHLSVDDFGTGYSSLTYLKRFPVEAIKIDRAFVNGLGIEADDTTIVDAVIKLGQALGLAVVAEGIETPLQLARLRELGCNRGQGYLFGRPRPAALIEADQLQV